MTKRMYCADTEGDNLLSDITKLHCMSLAELDPTLKVIRRFTITKVEDITAMFLDPNNILIMHNGIDFDVAAVEKLYKIKVEAEVIDTLFISWYLYPKRQRHGLELWGEDFGIAKPEVDDWEDQSLNVYIHRCQEDVKIQTALWLQMWDDLKHLYGTTSAAWHCVRHLNFKAKCAALQTKSKWKLDVDGCKDADNMFDSKIVLAKSELQANMPPVPIYKTATYPAKPFKMNGELSATGTKWVAKVLEHVDGEEYNYSDDPADIIKYKREFKYVSGYKEPNAGSSAQVKDWLFSMSWEPTSFSHVRDKITNKVRKIPQIKDPNTGLLCESISALIPYCSAVEHLDSLSIVTHRKSIVSGFLKSVDDDGFVIAGVQGLTNTTRFKHRTCLNIPSLRKPYGKLIRGLLQARSSATELCGSDMSSLEDRTKQHFMWKYDPEYVLEMQKEGFDPHLDMAIAANLVSDDDVAFYKSFDKKNHTEEEEARHTKIGLIRHAGKSTNYAATYGAQPATIARAAGVDISVGEKLFDAYWSRNSALIKIADSCRVKSHGGLKWLWNPVANLWVTLSNEKDKFSTLNQSTGTYCFDRWVYHILDQREQLTAQFHDEVILELQVGNREAMTKVLKTAIHRVNEELKLDRDLDCDVDFGRDYSEIH